MIPNNKKITLISNALDYSSDLKRKKSEIKKINDLKKMGFKPEILDLKKYFNNKLLKNKLDEFGAVFFTGENFFVLRKAMKLSGFDKIIKKILKMIILFVFRL